MKIRDECGVIGIRGSQAGDRAILGLQALQHRGQESAGVATFDGTLHLHKAMGLVTSVFSVPYKLPGDWAIGHNRYSTAGSSVHINAGPFTHESPSGPVAVAHNGNIVNAWELMEWMRDEYGLSPESNSDSELLAIMLAVAPGDSWAERIQWMASRVEGSYSLVVLAGERLIGVRDPMGNRPLAFGRLADGWVFASESCAISLLGGSLLRDVNPGEILEVNETGPTPLGTIPVSRLAFCALEHIYISRPDTIMAGRAVHSVRRSIGEELGREHPVDADLVIGVPDSGVSAALGYSTATEIPFGEGLIKNRYIGRTFIQPDQADRQRLIRMKFGVLPMHGRRIVLVDDSIIRGNTLVPIVNLLRDAGASEIHVRVAAPPLREPCYLGVHMATRDELVANSLDEEGLAERVGADSLRYVSIDGLLRAMRSTRGDTCLACFNGDYPHKLYSQQTVTRQRIEVEGVKV
jgi:amidophosphoribosyltransferase